MATSTLLTVADQVLVETRPEHAKPRGRTSSRGLNQKKKKPQRGLGVEQLERLRLQERWKMTEMPQPLPFSGQIQVQAPFPFSDPLTGVPVQCCPRSYCGREMIVRTGGLVLGNGGFSHESAAIGGLVIVDNYQFGLEDQQKELSSKPKMQSLSDHCNSGLRKKLLNVRNVGFDGDTHKKNEMSNINGSDFLRLNIENIPKIYAESSCFTADLNKGAEIKQIYRKGSSKNDSFLVEYEFFPGTCFKELNQFQTETEGSIAVEGEASCITTSNGDTCSNPVDLSLKLSF